MFQIRGDWVGMTAQGSVVYFQGWVLEEERGLVEKTGKIWIKPGVQLIEMSHLQFLSCDKCTTGMWNSIEETGWGVDKSSLYNLYNFSVNLKSPPVYFKSNKCHTHVQSLLENSPEVEATHVSTNGWMDKQNSVGSSLKEVFKQTFLQRRHTDG